MRLRLLQLAVLAALIIPLAAAAFNFAPTAPKPVPELSFFDVDGNEVTLADFKGEVVVLNLWATWCAPCRREMPSLDRLQAKYGGDGLEVIALSLDRGDIAKVRAFFDELGISNLALYQDPKGRAGRALDGLRVRGFLVELGTPDPDAVALIRNPEVLEMVTLPASGSVDEYADDGSPVPAPRPVDALID